jgi:hypothetical protein
MCASAPVYTVRMEPQVAPQSNSPRAPSPGLRLPDPRWQVRLHIASTGLLPHVRHAQVEQMAHLLKALDETQDPVALISVLLRVRRSHGPLTRPARAARPRPAAAPAGMRAGFPQRRRREPRLRARSPPACPNNPIPQSASRYMLRSCSMRMTARLALLQPDSASGSKALLFEAPRAPGAPPAGSPRHRLVAPTDATADVVASHMSLSNTLLASAVQQMQARFISDVGVYMQVGVPC